MNALDALERELVRTGAGGLPALDATAGAADVDLAAVAARRQKDAQADFAASQRAREAAEAVADVLARPVPLS